MSLAIYFVCCRMAKQKRKVTEVTGKKNKKLKVSARETPLAPEGAPGGEDTRPEVGARVALASPCLLTGREDGAVRLLASVWVEQRLTQVTRGHTQRL